MQTKYGVITKDTAPEQWAVPGISFKLNEGETEAMRAYKKDTQYFVYEVIFTPETDK